MPGHAASGTSTCSPATYDGGSVSSHWPGAAEPGVRRVAPRRRTAARESTTRFGGPGRPGGLDDQRRRVVGGVPRRASSVEDLAGGAVHGSSGRHGAAASRVRITLSPADESPTVATPAQWLAGARPRTLPAAVSPVLAGTGVAAYDDDAVWWKALLALVVALALQVGVNYANDYSDGIRGTDADRVGPMRLVGSGAASPGAVKRAAFAAFGVAAVAGLVLAATTAWWLVLVGALVRRGRLVLHRRLARPTATSGSAR